MNETPVSTFDALSSIDMSGKHKKKNGMSYLPWSCAWAAVKGYDPLATYRPVKTYSGCLYHTDGKTCWVETSMTVMGETQNETLAVMDHKNQAIPLDAVTSVAVNKSIKRCLVKNAALFGLDLNLWEGEELSDEVKKQRKEQQEKDKKARAALDAALKEIGELGRQLIAAGYTGADLHRVIGERNDGAENIADILSAETAAAVKEEFERMLSAKQSEKKTTTKKTAKETN